MSPGAGGRRGVVPAAAQLGLAPLSREEAYAMLLRHEAELKELREMISKKRARRATAPAAKDAAQTRLADLWIELVAGDPPGYLFQALMPLIPKHGWDRVAPVLRYVARKTETKFLRSAVQAIPATFGALEGEMRAFHGKHGTGGGNGQTAAPYTDDDYRAAVDWVLENGGPVAVASRIRAHAKKEGILWGQAFPPAAPELTFLVLQRAGEKS